MWPGPALGNDGVVSEFGKVCELSQVETGYQVWGMGLLEFLAAMSNMGGNRVEAAIDYMSCQVLMHVDIESRLGQLVSIGARCRWERSPHRWRP